MTHGDSDLNESVADGLRIAREIVFCPMSQETILGPESILNILELAARHFGPTTHRIYNHPIWPFRLRVKTASINGVFDHSYGHATN